MKYKQDIVFCTVIVSTRMDVLFFFTSFCSDVEVVSLDERFHSSRTYLQYNIGLTLQRKAGTTNLLYGRRMTRVMTGEKSEKKLVNCKRRVINME